MRRMFPANAGFEGPAIAVCRPGERPVPFAERNPAACEQEKHAILRMERALRIENALLFAARSSNGASARP